MLESYHVDGRTTSDRLVANCRLLLLCDSEMEFLLDKIDGKLAVGDASARNRNAGRSVQRVG